MVKRVTRRVQRTRRKMKRTMRSKQRGGTIMTKVEFKRAVFNAIKGKNDFKNHIDVHDDHVISVAADVAYNVYKAQGGGLYDRTNQQLVQNEEIAAAQKPLLKLIEAAKGALAQAQAAVAADPMNPALQAPVSSAQMTLDSAYNALNKMGLSTMDVGAEQLAADARAATDAGTAQYAQLQANDKARVNSYSQITPANQGLNVNQGANYSMWEGGAAANMNNETDSDSESGSDSDSESESDSDNSQTGGARPRRKRAMRKMRKNY